MEERKKQLFTFFGKISPKKLKKDQLLAEYPQVAIRVNATRKEQIFCRYT